MQHSPTFTSLAAILTAVLGTGCATTSPGIAYYDMNRTDAPRPKGGVNDVFVLDKAILKFAFPEGSKSSLAKTNTTGGVGGTEPATGQAGAPSSSTRPLPDWKTIPSPINAGATRTPAKKMESADPSQTQNQPPAQKAPEPPKQVKVTVELAESSQRIGFAGANDFRKTTTFNIVKRPDTELVQSAGASTTANLQTSINKIGTLLTGLAGVFRTVKTNDECDSFGKDVITAVNRNAQTGLNAGNCATYELGAIPADAIPVQEIPWGKEVSDFYYSACRTLKVTITAQGADKVEPLTFKIPDPNFVQAVRIPFKGSINKHATCGVSTVTEAQASPTASIEALTELVTQLNAYQAAKDDKKDGN
ncbi:hypothetical protein [Acidovorax sp. sic0104]|uniref:hypothetical protein n=1 Tax=Acidovorax sp. sic0104 TaxID=2854784 RepID=UPI001C48A105|nr:hypothetical protein [Acidovorax sp. sic0104]MBV7541957.1 hypothetical protein [Acidovorax sp. sic0104]